MKFRHTMFIKKEKSSAAASWLSSNSIGTNPKLTNSIAAHSYKDFLYSKVFSKINQKNWIRKQQSSLKKWNVTKCGRLVCWIVHKARHYMSILHFTQRLKSMITIFTQRWPLLFSKKMIQHRLPRPPTQANSTIVTPKKT